MVVVEVLLLGNNGFVRVVWVEVANVDRNLRIFIKSVKYLFSIEVNAKDVIEEEDYKECE